MGIFLKALIICLKKVGFWGSSIFAFNPEENERFKKIISKRLEKMRWIDGTIR
jgi:hypothetical protein